MGPMLDADDLPPGDSEELDVLLPPAEAVLLVAAAAAAPVAMSAIDQIRGLPF